MRLISGLEGFRERAALLAGEIARDHPNFTLHDSSHFDALWRLADLIAGPDFELTPAEAFVFGGAVLIHDLGMATAAYVDGSTGANSLRTDPRWPDKVAFILRDRLDRAPTRAEIESASSDVIDEATSALLRELHAERAEWLVKASWKGTDGSHYSLLEDAALRDAYGATIGSIAHSHWWDPATVGKTLSHVIGAASGCPSTWTVRPLTIACLLRLADASHLDSSRAPRFLQALRQPSGKSKNHWDFQGRMAQPFRKEDRLVYSSAPFGIEEAEAWWLCADTLKLLDHEFRSVDVLLIDHHETRFSARGIDGAHDLSRLAEHLPTNDWLPVDAKVEVSDIVSLVKGLGGTQLYGSAPHVPLRELLQNSADAIRARRIIENQGADWGEIVVRLAKDQGSAQLWLEVEDTGIGMSPDVLSGHLLDFGSSFWNSETVLSELPGLISQEFESTGRFGIGFFSVFMWSDTVTVISRKHDASKADTYALKFDEGLARRPILCRAKPDEQMSAPGTRIRVNISEDIFCQIGLANEYFSSALAKLCAWVAPALDVTLLVETGHTQEVVSVAGDWMQMRVYDLAMRVRKVPLQLGELPSWVSRSGHDVPDCLPLNARGRRRHIRRSRNTGPPPPAARSPLGDNARPLYTSAGKVAGRALIDPIESNGGVIVVGGFSAGYLKGIAGVLFGTPTTAARHRGLPGVCPESLAAWASEQANLISKKLFPGRELEAAALVRACNGDTGPLPVALTSAGWLNRDEFLSWISERDRFAFRFDEDRFGELLSSKLRDGFAATYAYPRRFLRVDDSFTSIRLRSDDLKLASRDSLLGLLIEVADQAWESSYAGDPELLHRTQPVYPDRVDERVLVRPSKL